MAKKKIEILSTHDRYNTYKSEKSFYEIAELYKATKLDGTFQRWGGVDRGSGWTHEQSRAWLKNALVGSTINQIVVADVDRCYEFAVKEKDQDSISYFGHLKKEEKKEFVSMDGNNTTSTVYHFVNSHEEMYLIIDGKKVYFKDLKEDDQRAIGTRQRIPFIEFREIHVDEMCDEFRNFNTSKALNAQEHRQAKWSPMSAFIREISNNPLTRGMFKTLTLTYQTDEKLDQRGHEEMVAQLMMKISKSYDTDIKREELDEFYNNVCNFDSADGRKIIDVLLVLGEMALGFDSPQKLSKGAIQNLADLVFSLQNEFNVEIKDKQKFYDWFIKKHESFNEESKLIVEEDKEECSYKFWSDTFNQRKYYLKTKEKFAACFVDDLESLEQEAVVKRLRTSKDYFSHKMKRQLLTLQEGQTRSGKNITIYDLANGKVEADHVVSHKDGGPTTIENGELMLTKENRSKGSNSWEPYFDFQQPQAQAS